MDDAFNRYLIALLPRFVGPLPEAELAHVVGELQRVHVGSGQALYRQGDAGDCMHFVVTGRLEVWVTDKYGERRLVAHLSSGDCVGELALLTGDPRAADVVVTRDTVLARLARRDYEAMVRKHPEAGLCIARHALRSLRGGGADLTPRLRNIAVRRTPPTGTAGWLAPRKSYRHSHVSWEGGQDFNRLARLLSGNAVTLVLGGGGARGLCQIGAIRAIRESGTPIDAVGGTSIGAIIGALVALGWADERILQSCKHAFVDDRPLDDMTIPMFAMLSGRKLARTLEHYIGGVDIEDLWRPFFCVSTNLSKSSSNVHHSGSLLQALQASISLPGLLPPVVAGGDLYVDGGVLDNLPVGVMKRFIGGNTIAVESGVKVEYQVKVDDFPSPLQYLKTRWSRRDDAALPTLATLLIKSTLLGGVGGRHELREGDDLHLNPPMRPFGFLDWSAIYEMVDVGYRYTQERLLPWLEGNPRVQRHDESLELPRERIPA